MSRQGAPVRSAQAIPLSTVRWSRAGRPTAGFCGGSKGCSLAHWMVERGHSWLNRFRRLLVRWKKREDTYLAMLHLASGIFT